MNIIWQDALLMAGGFVFVIALVPAVFAKEKPPRSTCLMTGLVLVAYTVAYATLGLWLAFASTILTAGMWLTLFFQKRKGR